MTGVENDIMRIVGCDESTARRIEAAMDIDFSECTQQEFEAEVRRGWAEVRFGAILGVYLKD